MNPSRMTLREPRVQKQYDDDRSMLRQKYGTHIPCLLCNRSRKTIRHSTDTMVVTTNDYPYIQFDGMVVEEHLMLIPKRHEASMGGFTGAERREYLQLLALYHQKGYTSMTRSLTDTNRTVPEHIHTHLLRYSEPLTVL